MRRLVHLLILFLAGCASQRSGAYGVSSDPASAAVMTAIAVGSSAVSRSAGGCYASCSYGTVCNKATGYCDTLPCRGLCTSDQECDVEGPVEKCVDRKAADLKIVTDPASPLTPR